MSELKDSVIKRVNIPVSMTKSFDPFAPMQIEALANATQVDRGNELMPKGCWDLTNYMLNPIVLFDHDYRRPIGKVDSIDETEKGLVVYATLGNTSAGHDLTVDQKMVRSLVAQKVLTSLSVGFIPKEWDTDENGVLVYKRVELLEVSIVSIPMQQNSQILNVKHQKETEDMATKAEKPEADKPEAKPGEEAHGNAQLAAIGKAMQEMHECMKEMHGYCKDLHAHWGKPAEDKPKEEEKKSEDVTGDTLASEGQNQDELAEMKSVNQKLEMALTEMTKTNNELVTRIQKMLALI